MATLNDSSQRPRLPLSQSFRTQSAQDALAEIGPSARITLGEQTKQDLYQPESATAIASKLGGTTLAEQTQVRDLNEENLHHRLNASGSVQAIVVDDDVLFAGLQGGEIVVSRNLVSAVLIVHSSNYSGMVSRHI